MQVNQNFRLDIKNLCFNINFSTELFTSVELRKQKLTVTLLANKFLSFV